MSQKGRVFDTGPFWYVWRNALTGGWSGVVGIVHVDIGAGEAAAFLMTDNKSLEKLYTKEV